MEDHFWHTQVQDSKYYLHLKGKYLFDTHVCMDVWHFSAFNMWTQPQTQPQTMVNKILVLKGLHKFRIRLNVTYFLVTSMILTAWLKSDCSYTKVDEIIFKLIIFFPPIFLYIDFCYVCYVIKIDSRGHLVSYMPTVLINKQLITISAKINNKRLSDSLVGLIMR